MCDYTPALAASVVTVRGSLCSVGGAASLLTFPDFRKPEVESNAALLRPWLRDDNARQVLGNLKAADSVILPRGKIPELHWIATRHFQTLDNGPLFRKGLHGHILDERARRGAKPLVANLNPSKPGTPAVHSPKAISCLNMPGG